MYVTCVFQNQLMFPDEIEDVPDQAKDLIRRLITSPEKRLGQNGINDFMEHPFFDGMSWNSLRDSELHNYSFCIIHKKLTNTDSPRLLLMSYAWMSHLVN